jgi:hypothetical protein
LDKEVNEGELIVLYTKKSDEYYKIKTSDKGDKSHFFYWHMSESVWNTPDRALVVGIFSKWTAHHVALDSADIEP